MENEELLRIARAQRGMFTTKQASDIGVGPKWLRESVRAGSVRHPARGLYAVSSLVGTSPEEWQGHMAAGAHLLYSDAVLTGVTAVLAHEVTTWGCSLARPELLRPIARQVGVKPYRVRPRRAEPVEGPWGPSVPLPVALVQLCLDHGILPGVVACDSALHRELVSMDELRAAVDDVATWPGSHRPRVMLTHVDPRSESVAESRTRFELRTDGIQVESQVPIRRRDGSLIGVADFRVKGTNVLVEVDGKVKYAEAEGEAPQTLWGEKRREDDMRAEGYGFARVVWADLETPGRAVAKVRRAMSAAAA